MASLLRSGTGADVIFKVQDKEICAHKLIMMARSLCFNAMLGSGMQEGARGVVHVEGIVPPIFSALLHFIYTDDLPEVHPNCLAAMMNICIWQY